MMLGTFATKAKIIAENAKSPPPVPAQTQSQPVAGQAQAKSVAAIPAPVVQPMIGSPIIDAHSSPLPKYSETLEEKHQEEIERIPMSMTRKAIAKNMRDSWTIPSATHMDLINATKLFNMVAKEKEGIKKERDIHLTFLPS